MPNATLILRIQNRTPLLGETIGEDCDRKRPRLSIRRRVRAAPDPRWTYRELHQDVSALALTLLGRGVAKGDRFGTGVPSSPEWFRLHDATVKIGAILVPINPAYRAHELQYGLDHPAGAPAPGPAK